MIKQLHEYPTQLTLSSSNTIEVKLQDDGKYWDLVVNGEEILCGSNYLVIYAYAKLLHWIECNLKVFKDECNSPDPKITIKHDSDIGSQIIKRGSEEYMIPRIDGLGLPWDLMDKDMIIMRHNRLRCFVKELAATKLMIDALEEEF